MRVLFTRFPLESSYGGAEVQTLTLAEGLRKRGHAIAFLGSCPTLCEGMTNHQIPITKLDMSPPPVTKWGAISFLWRKGAMRQKLLDALCPKSQVPSPFPGAIFMLSLSEKLLLTDFCIEHGIKVFWIEHDRIGRWLTRNPWLPRLRRLSKIVTTVVVSDLSRDLYLKLGWDPEKLVSIPNGIDINRFKPNPNPNPNPSPSPFRIGCIARLTHDKGVDLLIKAVASLPNVTLTIVGTGREEAHLRTLAESVNEKRKTHQQINVLPAMPDIPTFYHQIDVLVLPSRSHDPFGLVVAEAMAAGVPTIVTDACGIARHVSGEEALIVPAGSVSALRNAIETLMKFPQLAKDLAYHSQKTAQEKFSLERMVDAYEQLLSV